MSKTSRASLQHPSTGGITREKRLDRNRFNEGSNKWRLGVKTYVQLPGSLHS